MFRLYKMESSKSFSTPKRKPCSQYAALGRPGQRQKNIDQGCIMRGYQVAGMTVCAE